MSLVLKINKTYLDIHENKEKERFNFESDFKKQRTAQSHTLVLKK